MTKQNPSILALLSQPSRQREENNKGEFYGVSRSKNNLCRKGDSDLKKSKNGGRKMTGITDAIVGFWLLPVTLFIIVPLVTLCGWAVIKPFRSLMKKRAKVNQNENLEEGIILTKAG
jgi:hypothetical protein